MKNDIKDKKAKNLEGNILKEKGKEKKINMDLKSLKTLLLRNIGKNRKKLNKIKEKKRKVVAFDMGSSSIKIIEAVYYKKNLSISKYVEIPTPKGSIVDGEIKKQDELVLKIGQALEENKINSKDGICTTNSTLIINREISIPDVEEDEMETVARYEIQQYLPINLDDYILQIMVINEEVVEEVKKINIRVMAYPEKTARGYYNLLTRLNLNPYVLDVNYNAVNKFMNFINLYDNYEYNVSDSIAFIDMGASFIDVNIYKNRKLDFTRIIKAGGNDINEFLYETTGAKFEEIENLKKNEVNLIEGYDSANMAIRNIIDDWIEKVEKIINFYRNRNLGNSIDKIFVFGGCSKLNGFEEYMTSKIGITTKRISGISKMTFADNAGDESIEDFINVIGSVIRL
ncbi:MAG: type IV pilus assembly protein PilM [Clostridium beijerinckii]|jgi:type IV pilus assembly protein PilM|nr:type IV pilus assembly protein PilM [Clostridium beijerinckii]MCI1578376.1 type IV pilus assembly protein PilM [Clostridium beijerinckii]MCI1584128.1 type IV pilus assembly protein PilM [Clostridium beijerinckii]MCI1621691.1 type IV pilus assembly protein PilM [Clostridium beijerinckii]